MSTITNKQQEIERWRKNGYFIWTGDAMTLFSACTASHKAAHEVFTSFWESRCQECEWVATLMVWSGNPFDPMSNGTFALAVDKTLYVPKKCEA